MPANWVFWLYAVLAGSFAFVAVVSWFIYYESRKTIPALWALTVTSFVVVTGGLALVFAPNPPFEDTIMIRLTQRATFAGVLVVACWMTVNLGKLYNGRSSQVVKTLTWPISILRFLARQILHPGPKSDHDEPGGHPDQ